MIKSPFKSFLLATVSGLKVIEIVKLRLNQSVACNQNLRVFVAIVLAFLLAGCGNNGAKNTPAYDAIVSNGACGLKQNCFTSMQAALNAAKAKAERRVRAKYYFRIFVEPGDYREKVRIDVPWVIVEGEAATTTRLVNNIVAAEAGKYHRNNWGTPGSATLTINSADVIIRNIHIENDFNYLKNDGLAKDDPRRVKDSQAVALLLDVNSDRVKLSEVVLSAYQDTLFANGQRAYITKSRISGNVDFIFGNGQLLIENSDIVSRKRGKKFAKGQLQGHVTAPSTSMNNKFGLVFINDRLLREEGVPDNSHSLARPWHPTTSFPDGRYADPEAIGYAAYINCYMDAHIIPQAWGSMKGTARDGTKSRVFTPAESRFYEYNSSGPGAKREGNEGIILKEMDANALKKEMLGDWDV